jgi:hydrogenase nickel incorporation protein HypA/HybF
MHDRALMRDILGRIEALARAERATRVSRVTVRLGALSHFTPAHFCEHFEDAARGTIAEGASVDATLDTAIGAAEAHGVVLESLEVES